MVNKLCLYLILGWMITSTTNAQQVLWEIGSTNQNYSEFALAPDGYSSFTHDGFFVVGESSAKKDWPYCHPGPNDSWAGRRNHVFTVIFALSKVQPSGQAKLIIDLVDTHQGNPGTLKIRINGHPLVQKLPDGGGDVSIYGEAQEGRPSSLQFDLALSWLHTGNNELEIIKDDGSWLLYDALRMETPDGVKKGKVGTFIQITSCGINPIVRKEGNKTFQELSLKVKYAGKSQKINLAYDNQILGESLLIPGVQTITYPIPQIREEKDFTVVLQNQKEQLASFTGKTSPPGQRTVYILPHSHTDIGYTDVQTAIEEKQVENLLTGIQYARETQSYPEGSRFVWNIEVGWAADLYLNRLGEKEKQEFTEALKKGWISLNGMYLNELTGLCRPEELLRLFRYGTRLAQETGATVNAAMISDVPGYTWGTVTAMAQAGIKYFSVAPNYFDRIGDILVQWENKPFYWASPSGEEKVLVWIPYKGYAWSHTINELNEQHALVFLAQLDQMEYPYDIAYMRWSGHGDNAVPEKQICDFVKDWNAKYEWPRFVISSTGEAFSAFESAYGDQLETYSGDWTPYWEDGAGSSALETAMNRNTADRLTQTQALYALTGKTYPTDAFEAAWTNTLLYSEHTWGAWCSITDPENQLTRDQWEIKKGYADQADQMSRDLLTQVSSSPDQSGQIELVNANAWSRQEVIILQPEVSGEFISATDRQGQLIPSQKLSDGRLAIMPGLLGDFSKTPVFLTKTKESSMISENRVEVFLTASGNHLLTNGVIEVVVSSQTGNIISIKKSGDQNNLAQGGSMNEINQYIFFEGKGLEGFQTSGQPNIKVVENGPLVSIIEVSSTAPGSHSLTRRYQLTANSDLLEIENVVDKARAPMPNKVGDWYLAQNENKESVNFAFPFNIPGGIMRLDLPFGTIVPWKDQIPSACKNWYTVGRYADVSTEEYGISWFTLDAPLVEVGEISANLVGSQSDPEVWRKSVEPTQRLYSWAMNNHWGTNYRQYQEGQVKFRYALRPHDGYHAAETYRLATALSQPIQVQKFIPNDHEVPVRLQSEDLVLFSLKPVDSGSGYLIRIYNPGSKTAQGKLQTAHTIWMSNTGEEKIKSIGKELRISSMELLTLLLD